MNTVFPITNLLINVISLAHIKSGSSEKCPEYSSNCHFSRDSGSTILCCHSYILSLQLLISNLLAPSCLLNTQVSLIPASPSGSISGPPFTTLQPGAGNKIQVATVSQTNHAPEYQVQLSCSNYFATACIRLTMAEKISSFTRIV